MSEKYLILGASSEIGTAFIRQLEEGSTNREGCTRMVLAHYRHMTQELQQTIEQARNIQIIPIQADLSQNDEIVRMLEDIEKYLGCPTHILHLPASRLQYGKVKNLEWENIEQDIHIQVASLLLVLQRFLPQMAKNRFGKVVVMLSSVTLGMPPKYMTEYTVSKYALLGLMRSMAIEYADKNININGISPTMLDTKFLADVDDKIIELSAMQSAQKKNITIGEVVPTIQYLFSKASDYMNGVNINLSGGEY